MANRDINPEHVGLNELLAGASRHVLSLGERATLEFIKDLARGRDVVETCADLQRIRHDTYEALSAMMCTPVPGARQ